MFGLAVTPFLAGPLVQILGKCLREPICQGLGHDRVVIIVVALEFPAQLFDAETGANSERPQVISEVLTGTR